MVELKKFYFYQFFDYSIFLKSNKQCQSVEEFKLSGQKPYYGYLEESFSSLKELESLMRQKVKSLTISDVVMVILYTLELPTDYLEEIKKERLDLSNLSDKNILETLFSLSFFNDNIKLNVHIMFPLLFEDRVSINKLVQ